MSSVRTSAISLASGSNAGFLAPNDSFAWAAPGVFKELARALGGAKTGISMRPTLDRKVISWGIRFLAECTKSRAVHNSIAQLELASYSQRVQQEIEETENLQYHVRRKGSFYLFRDAAALEKAASARAIFVEYGVNQKVLDMDQVVELEPSLHRGRSIFAGAIYGIDDAVGDSLGFCTELSAITRSSFDVKYHYDCTVRSLIVRAGQVVGLSTSQGEMEADLVVLAAGIGSRALARDVGLTLPILPVKGYSATFPINDPDAVPVRPTSEQTSLVAWSNLGDRFRMSSSAEIVGEDWTCPSEKIDRLRNLGREVFGDAVDFDAGEGKACLRPMTPTGPPLIGHTRVRGLFLNTGHGHLGWTWASASGKVAADVVAGRDPGVDLSWGRRLPAWFSPTASPIGTLRGGQLA